MLTSIFFFSTRTHLCDSPVDGRHLWRSSVVWFNRWNVSWTKTWFFCFFLFSESVCDLKGLSLNLCLKGRDIISSTDWWLLGFYHLYVCWGWGLNVDAEPHGATHPDCSEVGSIVQPVDCGRVQTQVVVFADVAVKLQFLCDRKTKTPGEYLKHGRKAAPTDIKNDVTLQRGDV